jgi:hypothetical protein
VLPTLVKLGGGKVPTDRKIDGGDIWPLLAGEAGAKSPHEVFYYYRGLTLEGVRSGPWKLRLAIADRPVGKNAKPPATPLHDQLYNLDADIGESKDVAEANPEVMTRLRALVEAAKDDLGLDGMGPGVRPLGRVEHPQPLIGADGTIRPEFAPK